MSQYFTPPLSYTWLWTGAVPPKWKVDPSLRPFLSSYFFLFIKLAPKGLSKFETSSVTIPIGELSAVIASFSEGCEDCSAFYKPNQNLDSGGDSLFGLKTSPSSYGSSHCLRSSFRESTKDGVASEAISTSLVQRSASFYPTLLIRLIRGV